MLHTIEILLPVKPFLLSSVNKRGPLSSETDERPAPSQPNYGLLGPPVSVGSIGFLQLTIRLKPSTCSPRSARLARRYDRHKLTVVRILPEEQRHRRSTPKVLHIRRRTIGVRVRRSGRHPTRHRSRFTQSGDSFTERIRRQ